MDAVLGLKVANEEPATDEMELGSHRLTTLLWAPVQFVTVFGVLRYVSLFGHLGAGLFVGVVVIAGTMASITAMRRCIKSYGLSDGLPISCWLWCCIFIFAGGITAILARHMIR